MSPDRSISVRFFCDAQRQIAVQLIPFRSANHRRINTIRVKSFHSISFLVIPFACFVELSDGSFWHAAGKYHCSDVHPQDCIPGGSWWMWAGGGP